MEIYDKEIMNNIGNDEEKCEHLEKNEDKNEINSKNDENFEIKNSTILIQCNKEVNKEFIENKISKNLPTISKNDQIIPQTYDFLFKVSLLGDSGTGKTSLLMRLTDNVFNANTSSTIGVDFKILSLKYRNKLAKIQLWDTCGSERFKSLTTSFIKTCSVFIIIFDLTNKKTFLNTVYWIDLVLDNTSPKLIYIIGNKSDLIKKSNDSLTEKPESELAESEKITKEEIEKLCSKYSMRYFESSAKDNTNIEEMFQQLVIELFNDAISEISKKNDDGIFTNGKKIILSDEIENKISSENNVKKKKKSCCNKM